jgi:RNA polymerase sigma-70 factor (ECF subfamily)
MRARAEAGGSIATLQVADVAAFEATFQRHYEGVRDMASRRLADRATAEDIAQESFIRLVGVAAGGKVTSPGAYVRQIARNLCSDHKRRKRLALRALQEVDIDPAPNPLDAQLARELRRQVHSTLARLKPTQRKALLLWGVERRSYQEVGQALGLSQRGAEGMIARARRRFRSEFERDQGCDTRPSVSIAAPTQFLTRSSNSVWRRPMTRGRSVSMVVSNTRTTIE